MASQIRSDPGMLPVGLAWSRSLEPPTYTPAVAPPAAFNTPTLVVGSLVIGGFIGAPVAAYALANPTAVGFGFCALLAVLAPSAIDLQFSVSYLPPHFSPVGLCAAMEAAAFVALSATTLLGHGSARLQWPLFAAAAGLSLGQLLRLHRPGGSVLLGVLRLMHDAWTGRILLLAALIAAHISFAPPTVRGTSTPGKGSGGGAAAASAPAAAPTGSSKPAAPLAAPSSLLVPPAPLFRFTSR